MKRQGTWRWCMGVLLMMAAVAGAAERVQQVYEDAETAGISGFRAMWNQPVVTAPDGVRRRQDNKIDDRGFAAPWAPNARAGGEKPGANAFDAINRSLLIRFPGAAEKIAGQIGKGYKIEKAELVLPWRDTELWPDGNQSWAPPEGGYIYRANWGVDRDYRNCRPKWHAVAWALRRPWRADPRIGPTYNAWINGAGYWARFGAQNSERDRFPKRFGPAPVHHEHTVGRMEVTEVLTTEAFGETLAERLRSISDCGFLVKKWETYDHRYYTGPYEWGTATGGRAILINKPKLAVSFVKAADTPDVGQLPPAADVAALAEQLKKTGRGGQPTALMPTRDELKKIAEGFAPARQPWMPEWQWERVQELMAVGFGKGAAQKPFWYQFVPGYIQGRYTQRFKSKKDGWVVDGHDPEHIYWAWVDQMLGKQYRGWYGFEASRALLPWFVYRDAMPQPVQEWFLAYWTNWLMPERPIAPTHAKMMDPHYVEGPLVHPMVDTLVAKRQPKPWKGIFDIYYEKTGDWRGNKSFYRAGFTHTMSTTNFNHTASMGALLGGAVINKPLPIEDGRHGMIHWPLKQWTWYDGSSQEDIDHYYFAITLTAQKMVADFGPEHFDRVMGRSMLTKSINLMADAYHPRLHRFIAGSSRTATHHLLVTQDGLYHILHTLSPDGVLRDLENKQIPETLPLIGQDLRPGQVARQTAVSPWAPEWVSNMVDSKPVPYQVTSAYTMWGGHRKHPIMRRHYHGRDVGLYSANAQTGNIPVLGHWRRSADESRMQNIVTMLMRFGINRTRLVNDAGGWIATYGSQAVLQHGPKMIVSASPWEYGRWINERRKIKSLQSSIALYNFERPKPSWRIYIDGEPVNKLPAQAKAGQVIAIHDGLSYLGVIPLESTDLGRKAEVVIRDGGPQTYYNSYTVAAALVFDNYMMQRDEELKKDADWEKIDKAYGGFVVELGDAASFDSFEAFRKHMTAATVESSYDAENAVHEVTYRSGKDVMKSAAKTTWRENQKLDQLFTEQTINGEPAYLPRGLFRDSQLVQQATTGRLEKNGAVLRTEPGHMTFLQMEPISGTWAGYNVLAEPNWFDLTVPGGVRAIANGRVGIASVVIQPKRNQVVIEHAMTEKQARRKDAADAIVIFGMDENTQVTVNGEKLKEVQQVTVNGKRALRIPLDVRGAHTDALDDRLKVVEEALEK